MKSRRTPTRRARAKERPGIVTRGALALARRPVSSLATVGGTAMVAMISVNALMLQSGPHPAPLFAGHSTPAVETSSAAPGGAATGDVAGDALVRDVQAALADLGYYDGPVDGLDGNATAAAISDFEAANGIPPTGTVSEALLARALTAAPRGAAATPVKTTPVKTASVQAGAVVPKPHSPAAGGSDEVRRVQKALADLGYGPITIDGLAGGQTSSAVRRFRLDHGLPVSGDIDAALVETLVRIGGLPSG